MVRIKLDCLLNPLEQHQNGWLSAFTIIKTLIISLYLTHFLSSLCSSSEPQDYSDPSRPMSPSKPKVVSVQSFPSPSFLSGHTPEGHTGLHPELVPQVYLSDVFSLAPQVAAKMVLDREEVSQFFIRRILFRLAILLFCVYLFECLCCVICSLKNLTLHSCGKF